MSLLSSNIKFRVVSIFSTYDAPLKNLATSFTLMNISKFYTSICIKKSRIRVFMRFDKISFFYVPTCPLFYCQLDVKNVKVFCLSCVSVYVAIRCRSLLKHCIVYSFCSDKCHYRKALAIALQIPSSSSTLLLAH